MSWLTSEEFNFIQAGYSASTASNTTYETSHSVNMGLYNSVVGIVSLGNNTTAGANNLFVCVGSTASTSYTYGFGGYNYRYCTTGDTMSAYATGASTALAAVTTAGIMYVIEVKADDLPASTPYIAVCMSTNAAARNCQIVYVAKPRYLQNVMISAST